MEVSCIEEDRSRPSPLARPVFWMKANLSHSNQLGKENQVGRLRLLPSFDVFWLRGSVALPAANFEDSTHRTSWTRIRSGEAGLNWSRTCWWARLLGRSLST